MRNSFFRSNLFLLMVKKTLVRVGGGKHIFVGKRMVSQTFWETRIFGGKKVFFGGKQFFLVSKHYWWGGRIPRGPTLLCQRSTNLTTSARYNSFCICLLFLFIFVCCFCLYLFVYICLLHLFVCYLAILLPSLLNNLFNSINQFFETQ